MKNIAIVALLAAVVSVGALAACGGDSQPAKAPDNSAAGASSAAPADSSAAPASSAK